MSTIAASKLKEVREMYYGEQLSVSEIARRLNVSIDATYYFFRNHGIKRRTGSEQQAILFARKASSFSLKSRLRTFDKDLKHAGVVLYWGEGYKAGETIDFANSDPDMISVFLNFLRTICGIQESRLRVYMYCYANQRPEELINYWSKLTNIPVTQFSKPYIRQDYKLGKEGKMRYGLIHIRYHDKKLWLVIMGWINDLKSKYA